MTAKTLRQSVLQCAMQGKLVPQDPSDEPASVLLGRIRKEQEKVFDKNYVDTCIYKGLNGRFYEKAGEKEKDITEDIPFEIPESWNWARLGSVYEITMGQSPKGSDVSTGGEGMEFHQGKIFFGSKYLMQSDKKTVKPTKIINRKSVLLCVRAPVGEVNIVDREICVGRGLCAITSRECPIEFLYYLLCALKQSFVRQSAGSTFTEISLDVVKNQLVPIPSLSEQQRIVEALDKIYPLLDEYERLEKESSRLDGEICDKLRDSILQHAMQGKLVPQNFSDEPASVLFSEIKEEQHKKLGKNYVDSYIFKGADEEFYEKVGNTEHNISNDLPFEVPMGWEWTRLSSLCEILNGDRGKNYPAKSKLSNKGIPFISALNLDGEKVVVDSNLMCLTEEQFNVLRAGKLCKDDIVVCIRGSIGKHARYQFDRGAIASSLVILRPFHKSEALASFIMSYLDSPLFYAELDKYINGSAQPNLSAKNFGQFLVPLPPLAEQQRIVEAVDRAFVQMDALEAAIKSSGLA